MEKTISLDLFNEGYVILQVSNWLGISLKDQNYNYYHGIEGHDLKRSDEKDE